MQQKRLAKEMDKNMDKKFAEQYHERVSQFEKQNQDFLEGKRQYYNKVLD